MCGILGFITRNKSQDTFTFSKGKKSLNLLDRRGPDAKKTVFIEENKYNIFFGHTRLAIQDLSSEYNQPYKSNFSENILVYNGEIYNYNDFKTYKNYTSDTKALYDLLSNKKEKLSSFDGIFAFAFWNDLEKKLYLGKDRFGVKPLFVFHDDNVFAYSSSLRALQEICDQKNDFNKKYIEESLNYGYTHDNQTIIGNISKLDKNTLLSFNPINWNFEKESIYKTKNKKDFKKSILLRDLQENIKKTLKSQIEKSNRGVGFFLSGGTDSSLLVTETLKLNPNFNINTFSLIVPGKLTDESQNLFLFRKFLKRFKNIKFRNTEFTKDQIKNALDLYPKLDYPVLDISIIPTIILSKSVSKEIRVILSGDGADELFFGYPRIYNAFWRFIILSFLPLKIKEYLSKFFKNNSKLRKYLEAKNPLSIRMILLGIDQNNNAYSWKAKNNLCSIFKSLNDYEINYYLPSVLEKVDAASMLSSLEVRVPYLSNNIVNYLDEVSIWNFILRRTAKFHLRKLLSLDTSKSYAFSSKKGFSFYRKDQVNFIIEYLENRKYKVLLKKNLEEKIKKNKIQYIRLLLLKHWIFGFNEMFKNEK